MKTGKNDLYHPTVYVSRCRKEFVTTGNNLKCRWVTWSHKKDDTFTKLGLGLFGHCMDSTLLFWPLPAPIYANSLIHKYSLELHELRRAFYFPGCWIAGWRFEFPPCLYGYKSFRLYEYVWFTNFQNSPSTREHESSSSLSDINPFLGPWHKRASLNLAPSPFSVPRQDRTINITILPWHSLDWDLSSWLAFLLIYSWYCFLKN